MRELNFYKYAAILLLVINLGTLAFFFTRRPPHRPLPPGHSMKEGHNQKFQEKTMEILDLDEAQRVIFVKLATEHHQAIKTINEQQKELLMNEFDSLNDIVKNVGFNKNLESFETLEGEKITTIFEHFRAIKAILKPEQLPNFEEYMNGAKRHLLRGKKKKKH